MTRPLVSVVMIFLNEERFLPDAIASVLEQDCEEWELFLVDDGSTDRSSEIARTYALSDDRIRLLEHSGHENLGMAASRALALDSANGDVMSFLDADDVWEEDTLSRQLTLLDRHKGAAMVCAAALWWGSWDGSGSDFCDTVVSRAPMRDAPIEPPGFAVAMIRDGASVPCNCSIAVRTADLRELEGFEVSFRDLYEDQMLYAKFGLERRVLVSTDCLGRYRQHPGQCCARAAEDGTLGGARRRFLEWLVTWADERRLDDPSLRRELTSALHEFMPDGSTVP
jgi:glycosyltransferase involved in cell wall biosynthesis